MSIISNKSFVLSQLLSESILTQIQIKKDGSREHKKVIIDFKGNVLYQSFKKVIDFCYMDDLKVLNQINDSSEMIEIIKLSNHYKLNALLKAAETYFQDQLVNWLESNSTCLSLKLQPQITSGRKKQPAPNNPGHQKAEGEQISK